MRPFIALILTVALMGCTLSADVESAVKDGIAINAGHAKDEGLPKPARDIALDNHDLLWDVLYRGGSVDTLPTEVRARKDARK